jgi:hypothetical protein
MAIGSGYKACRGGAEMRRRVGWANDIAGDLRGTRAQALSFHSVNIVGGLLRGGDGYRGRARHVGSPACQGQFGFCGE